MDSGYDEHAGLPWGSLSLKRPSMANPPKVAVPSSPEASMARMSETPGYQSEFKDSQNRHDPMVKNAESGEKRMKLSRAQTFAFG
jgi:hypothetical protein